MTRSDQIRLALLKAAGSALRLLGFPGIELLAPERQLTRRGSLLSPNFLPIMASVAFIASATSALSSSV